VFQALAYLKIGADSSVTLLHVMNSDQLNVNKRLSPEANQAIAKALVMAEAGGHALLTRSEKAVPAQWGRVQSQLVKGRPATAITRFARRHRCDLIVMGCRGLTEFRSFLLGSVSRRVLTEAPCSVLVIKRRVKSLQNVLIGVDGSKDARAAVELLLRLRPPKEINATVVSVVPPLPLETDVAPEELLTVVEDVRRPLEKHAYEIAEQSADRLRQAGAKATASAVHGHVGRELVELARLSKADLILVGSRGLTGSARYLLGSVSETVVKYADCPVLIFRRS
jgi:nucleotide-binding universal stress UspA family protein